jgi:riboflavin biosynthesis pyrimidine reductase
MSNRIVPDLTVAPLEQIYDRKGNLDLPLPSSLADLYGRLGFPARAAGPYVISNFVSTLDGVVAIEAPGQAIGDVIGGYNQQDSMVMGLLRAVADAVIVGAGTLRGSPNHLWTPGHVFPPGADAYRELRTRLGLPPAPTTVIVTATGNIDVDLPIFRSDEIPVLIVTTAEGARHIGSMQLPQPVRVTTGGAGKALTARGILDAIIAANHPGRLMLIEGGPHLMGEFLAERRLNELFLTLAPQVAGRGPSEARMGIVEGKTLVPEFPSWATLVSAKRGGSHLFLRYAFSPAA